MKIGILGGSFDPPHNGHLYIANLLLTNKYCQKIILVPAFKHPFCKPLTDVTHRLAMTMLLTLYPVIPAKAGIQQSTRFPIKSGMTKMRTMNKFLESRDIKVSDIEIKRGKISYTIDTLNALKTQSPKDDFVWIIGKDQIGSFEKWKNWREIIGRFGLIVVPRHKRHFGEPRLTRRLQNQGSRTDSGRAPSSLARMTGSGITVLNDKIFKPINISSSQIRQRIKEDLNIDNLVPKKVKSYIIKNKLYLE